MRVSKVIGLIVATCGFLASNAASAGTISYAPFACSVLNGDMKSDPSFSFQLSKPVASGNDLRAEIKPVNEHAPFAKMIVFDEAKLHTFPSPGIDPGFVMFTIFGRTVTEHDVARFMLMKRIKLDKNIEQFNLDVTLNDLKFKANCSQSSQQDSES